MSTEGSIQIELRTCDSGVDAVALRSTRPVLAARVFRGRTVSEVLRILPLLFMVCGTAQATASVRAVENALGIAPSPELNQLRERLVDMETVREHLGRVLLDWPVFLSESPDTLHQSQIMDLARRFRDVLRERNPFSIDGSIRAGRQMNVGDIVEGMSHILEQAVFGMPCVRWLEIADLDALSKWASGGTTASSRLVAEVIGKGWADSGRCTIEALPDLDDSLLQSLVDDEFVRRPHWMGECRETSSFTRTDGALLHQLRAQFGNGILVRIVARLTEVARLSPVSSATVPGAGDDSAGGHERPAPGEMNVGVGQVAAARGMLVHRVRLVGETVEEYHILAPTEWNFHPRGVVSEGLGALRGDRASIDAQARLLISSVDPCVEFGLSIS